MSAATDVSLPGVPRGGQRRRSPFTALALVADRVAQRADSLSWPSDRYRDDPVAFVREVLGDEPWSRQIEVLEAVREHKRVAVASGHKIGKSRCAAGLALWFYCSFPDARVVLSSTTSRQVDQILWRELRKMHGRAKAPIDGDMHELARSGLKAPDFREIVGFTAKDAEAVAGISGANLLYLLDEASGIPEVIFEAIEGNRAGGARLAMFSNPTRTEGEFYEAFESKARFYKTIRISSEETPNVVEGRAVIPGLATREWVEEKREEWGEESALYKIRVRGEFVTNEDGKIVTVDALTAAHERWLDWRGDTKLPMPEFPSHSEPLSIGLDPAGPGGAGDESVFTVRRANVVLGQFAFRGLTDGGHMAHVFGLIDQFKLRAPAREMGPARVIVDREGPIGGGLWGLMSAHARSHPGSFEVHGVRASDKAPRMPLTYDRLRDELWANLAEWVTKGGCIPEDDKLDRELHAPEWVGQITGRLKATGKDEMRKALGRSPDRADSLALAVWEPVRGARLTPDEASAIAAVTPVQPVNPYEQGRAMDPYRGVRGGGSNSGGGFRF